MSQPIALVTGAGGEMGRLLVPALIEHGMGVVALDLGALPPELEARCVASARMNVLDTTGVQQLMRSHQPTFVFHLAALLSSHAERDPGLAHRVNVEATLELFNLCRQVGAEPVRFLFPSSIAIYGFPNAAVKTAAGALKEWQWNTPTGIYGCNKLYCELVGTYLSRHPLADSVAFDFRSIRFPGLISAETLPSGGTTDFAPELIHAAAQHKPYSCFVTENTRLPFMTMPDAIDALVRLALADEDALTRRVYNIKGFSCSAGEILAEVRSYFPDAEVTFDSVARKQRAVDSWPADVDDSRARKDWGLDPQHGLQEALGAYLVPALRERYKGQT